MEKQTQYRHINTNTVVTYIPTNSLSHQYVGNGVNLPKWVVENSDDWQKVTPPTDDDEPLYSINDVKKAMQLHTNHCINIIGKKIDLLIYLRQTKNG